MHLCIQAGCKVHLERVPGVPGRADLCTWAEYQENLGNVQDPPGQSLHNMYLGRVISAPRQGTRCTWAWGPVHLGRRVGQEEGPSGTDIRCTWVGCQVHLGRVPEVHLSLGTCAPGQEGGAGG